MKNFFGPFFEDGNHKLHWRKNCPEFPGNANPKTILSSNIPDKADLCETCAKIDGEEKDGKRMTMLQK